MQPIENRQSKIENFEAEELTAIMAASRISASRNRESKTGM